VKAIAQLVINKSTIDITMAEITSPTNGNFNLHMLGIISHTGFIPAVIHYTQPVKVRCFLSLFREFIWCLEKVQWLRTPDTWVDIGQMNLTSPISAKHKRATLDQTTVFNITDSAAFGEFTQAMITQESFTWRLTSSGLRVNAVKFPVATGINFDKNLTINGINSFNGNVTLNEFLVCLS
jgi:hypothetical protein